MLKSTESFGLCFCNYTDRRVARGSSHHSIKRRTRITNRERPPNAHKSFDFRWIAEGSNLQSSKNEIERHRHKFHECFWRMPNLRRHLFIHSFDSVFVWLISNARVFHRLACTIINGRHKHFGDHCLHSMRSSQTPLSETILFCWFAIYSLRTNQPSFFFLLLFLLSFGCIFGQVKCCDTNACDTEICIAI